MKTIEKYLYLGMKPIHVPSNPYPHHTHAMRPPSNARNLLSWIVRQQESHLTHRSDPLSTVDWWSEKDLRVQHALQKVQCRLEDKYWRRVPGGSRDAQPDGGMKRSPLEVRLKACSSYRSLAAFMQVFGLSLRANAPSTGILGTSRAGLGELKEN